MSAAEKVLSRLVRARKTRDNNWVAACPCCQSRVGRPLSVRIVEGRLLMYGFCGCRTEEILSAIGLAVSDLFDKTLDQYLPPVRVGFTSRELLELVSHEVTVAAILIHDAETKRLTPLECSRLRQAAARISTAESFLHDR